MAGLPSKSIDDRVLDVIFNPDEPMLGLELGDDVSGDGVEDDGVSGDGVEDDGVSGDGVESEDSEEVKHAKMLEIQAVKVAEGGNLSDALELLTKTISEVPHYASCYNNRAQVYRLLSQVDLALSDLDKAIQLSNGRGKVAEQAYTQRGLIKRLRGDDEHALEDFKAAANLGSRFARKQVVKMNPYAALCSQMLSQAFDRMKTGEEL